jgi:hypothetical protein
MKPILRKLPPTHWLLAAVVFLSLIFRLPAELAVRLESVTASLPEFGSNNVMVVKDERIFTLFAALNATGFDREYPGITMSPVRQKVRAALAVKNLPSLAQLKPIFERVTDYHLVVWVLQRGNPPGFGRAEAGWWVSTRAADFAGLAEALGAFYREADIPTIWRQVQPEYQSELNRWQPLAENAELDTRSYLRETVTPYRKLVIIPNLLDSYYSGNGPQIGGTAYVVAGPTETELSLRGLIEHETLHSLIGPMLDRQRASIPNATSRRLYAVLKDTMPAGYGTWDSVLEESLNRAINLRMLPDDQLRASQLDRLESEGFLLIQPLDQALAAYEKSGLSFTEYLPILLGSLNNLEIPRKR